MNKQKKKQGGTVQATLCPPPGLTPAKDKHVLRKIQEKEKRKSVPIPYSACADTMNGGVGRNS